MQKIKKLSRKQIHEGLETIPISDILGASVTRELTPKQRAFAKEVAKGSTKANAYRKAYKATATQRTMACKPYELMRDERIQREIEAYKLALEAQEYRTPAALRALIVQALTQTIIDPDTPPAVRVQAAKVAGQITEVSLYTERKEVRTISSSEDAKRNVMEQIRQLMKDSATDAQVIEHEADSLLKELAQGETHPEVAPQAVQEEALSNLHTIPDERTDVLSSSIPDERFPQESISPRNSYVTLFPDSDPTPSYREDPPVNDSGKSA